MFRQKSAVFFLFAFVLVIAVACTSATPTVTPVPPTPTPTATPEPTATPVPVVPITVDPTLDAAGFFAALPSDESSCFSTAVGGQDRALTIVDLDLDSDPITATEAEAIDRCFSDATVHRVFVGQLTPEGGELSDETIICIGEQAGGLSAASLFTDEPAVGSAISLLKGVFCLNDEERAALSASDSMAGFGEFGGIDALECVVDGVGPTGLEDLMGTFSTGELDFAALGDLFPMFLECGAIDDSTFEESGITVDQIGCVLSALGEDGLALIDPTAGEPDLSDLGGIFTALDACGLDLEDLMESSTLPLDPSAGGGSLVVPTAEVESPGDVPEIGDIDLPFTEEQINCLIAELGEDEINNLLSGGAPDLSLFGALTACEIDALSLLAP